MIAATPTKSSTDRWFLDIHQKTDVPASQYFAAQRLGDLSKLFSAIGYRLPTTTAPGEVCKVTAMWDARPFTILRKPSLFALPCLELDLNFELSLWSRPWTFAQLVDEYKLRLAELQPTIGFEDELIPGRLKLSFAGLPPDATLGEYVSQCAKTATDVLTPTIAALDARARRDSVVTFFEFPPAVRTACQQYLIYFVQFLSDLGIEADADLKEEAHRVLFTVTPRTGPEALNQIREALAAFLSLPESSDAWSPVGASNDIAVQQLRANVLHLQSQLELAQAIGQAKDAIIDAQRVRLHALTLVAYQYRQLFLSSLESAKPNYDASSTADSEPLIEDVSVTRYKGKFVEVDTPSLLRKLKRRLSDEP